MCGGCKILVVASVCVRAEYTFRVSGIIVRGEIVSCGVAVCVALVHFVGLSTSYFTHMNESWISVCVSG